MSICDDGRRVIKSILNTHTRGGATIDQLRDEYKSDMGATLGANAQEAIAILLEIPGVRNRNGRWFIEDPKMEHISNMIKGQKPGKAAAGRVMARRKTIATDNNMYGPPPNRRFIPYNKPSGPVRHDFNRRSRSPPANSQRSRSQERRMPSHSRNAPGPSRDEAPRRNWAEQPNLPPARDLHGAARDKSQERRTKSPSRDAHNTFADRRTRWNPMSTNGNEQVPSVQSYQMPEEIPVNRQHNHSPQLQNCNPQRPPAPASSQPRPATNIRQMEPTNADATAYMIRKQIFVFDVIGDDYMMLFAMTNMNMFNNPLKSWSLCKNGQSIKNVIDIIRRVQIVNGRHVFINIGYTDIRQNMSIDEFKKSYEELISCCRRCGMIPLVSTILPRDTTDFQLIKPFNDFLLEKYNNVMNLSNINMRDFIRKLKRLVKLNDPCTPIDEITDLYWNIKGEDLILRTCSVFQRN